MLPAGRRSAPESRPSLSATSLYPPLAFSLRPPLEQPPANRYISETIEDRHILQRKTNRKSHTGFRLVPILITSNEHERP